MEKRVTRSSVRGKNGIDKKDTDSKKLSVERKRVSSKDLKVKLGFDLCKQSTYDTAVEKRVTRSSVHRNNFVNKENICSEIEPGEKVRVSSKGSKAKVGFDPCKQSTDNTEKMVVMEKRVTRSSILGNIVVNTECTISEKRVRVPSEEVKAKVGFDSCNQRVDNIEKRVTRSATRTKKADNVSTDELHKVVNSDERKRKVNLCTSNTDVQAGEKRKKHQVVGEDYARTPGWTEEQELALRRAYLTAKPTPRFWKKVASMVPGKSADECFNRIHYDHLTPPQPRTRSRANRKQPSPVSYSASKLLSSPDEIKTKKPRASRRTLVAQKRVRNLLEKQRGEDRDYKADLFSVLEPSIKLSSSPLDIQESTPFASPVPNRGSSILTRCLEMSSSAHKKQLPRLSCLRKASLVSPPVLKQIKNKGLHDKYIDLLHCRDAKRKAESKRNAKCVGGKDEKIGSQLEVNLVKVAKIALVNDARVAISKFPNLQSSTRFDIGDDDDDDTMSCYNEDDDELY